MPLPMVPVEAQRLATGEICNRNAANSTVRQIKKGGKRARVASERCLLTLTFAASRGILSLTLVAPVVFPSAVVPS